MVAPSQATPTQEPTRAEDPGEGVGRNVIVFSDRRSCDAILGFVRIWYSIRAYLPTAAVRSVLPPQFGQASVGTALTPGSPSVPCRTESYADFEAKMPLFLHICTYSQRCSPGPESLAAFTARVRSTLLNFDGHLLLEPKLTNISNRLKKCIKNDGGRVN